MWFKNLAVYKFTESTTAINADALNEALKQKPFTPCQAQDEFSFGFVSPINESFESLVCEPGNQYVMICGKREEKVLPSAAINEELGKRIKEIEEREVRKLPSKERIRMKDELIFELLPRAMTVSKKTHAYIDVKNGYLIVDAASASKAEDLLSHLRKCLGYLPVVPFSASTKAANEMTSWLLDPQENKPAVFNIEDECELRSPEENGGIVRCKRHDLEVSEIHNHLEIGKQVHKLALTWKDRISFTLDTDLAIKSLKFLDLVQEQAADIEAFDEVEQFEAEFTIMAGEISGLLADLSIAFGLKGE